MSVSNLGASAFNNFIHNSGLIEIKNGGRKFTRISSDGLKLSKLDRILVSHNFFEFYANPIVEILPRSFSDHCPILLSSPNLDFGAPPFRFFNSWLKDASLYGVVQNSWMNCRANWSSQSNCSVWFPS